MSRLATRTAVVTGGASGIGLAIATAFLKEGAAVAIIDRDTGALADATAMLAKETGGRLGAVEADVADEQSVVEAFATVERTLSPVDILVNNAGIINYATVADMPVALWDEMFAINMRSMFLCSRAVIGGMQRRKFGRIINISSQLAQIGAAQLAHYSAAKAGVLGFTRAFAREVIGDGVTVNAICPGPIDTPLSRTNELAWRERLLLEIPAGRYGEPHEIAPAALMLAGDDAGFFVGSCVNPNGGHAMT